MMKNMEPELYLMLGDLTHELTLNCWFNMVRSTGSAVKVTIGNHDVESSVLRELMKDFNMAKQYAIRLIIVTLICFRFQVS